MTAEEHYDGQMDAATLQKWAAATTLADLGELVAQWLEGTLPSQVGYTPNCGPDDETTELVPILAALNRAGFLTDGSQPGHHDHPGWDGSRWQQRAAVCGFVDRDEVMLDRLRTAVEGTGLVLEEDCPDDGIVVTWRNGEPFTRFGCWRELDELEECYVGCSREALVAVRDAIEIVVYDPEIGRNDLLWSILAKVVG